MISIIMPYWNRQWAANVGIDSLVRCYGAMDIELVVIDDGSKLEPFACPTNLPAHWSVVVDHLPLKDEPKNPCVPINRGVALSSGDIVCLTNPEMLHYHPILQPMLDELKVLGEDGYVLASVWSVEQGRWHQHSSHTKKHKSRVAGVKLRCGLAFHFFSIMHRSLWDRSGGLCAEYRDGAGYDDPDLALRLLKAGARFSLRDDLVVWHPRTGARADFTPEMFEHNRKIFISKWKREKRVRNDPEIEHLTGVVQTMIDAGATVVFPPKMRD